MNFPMEPTVLRTIRRGLRVPACIAGLALCFSAPPAGAQYFSPAAFYNAGNNGNLQAFDLNGDGKPDFVASNTSANTISVSLNNGNGTFAAKTDYLIGANSSSFIVQDLNGDGRPDILALSYIGGPSSGNPISVLINNGNGTFKPKVDYAVGGYPELDDVTGDGKPDLVSLDQFANVVSVLINNGSGAFGAKTDYSVAAESSSIQVQDLNGDGKLDIVATGYSSGFFSVLLNNGNGTFKPKTDYAVSGFNSVSDALPDLNGDSRPDFVALDSGANTVSVYLNNGNGTFAAKTDYPVASGSYSIYVQDLNGDGKSDIVTNDSATASILLNNGNGTFKVKADYSVGGYLATDYITASGTTFADLSGDSKPDFIATDTNAGTFSISLNKGDGTFAAKTDYAIITSGTANAGFYVIAQDLNGDGKLDILAVNYASNIISVLLNKGNGTFAAKVDYDSGGNGLVYGDSLPFLYLRDVNGDGKPDFVTLNRASSVVIVLFNNGAGAFTTRTDYPVAAGSTSAFLLDLNGDSKLDLVGSNSAATVSVLLNQAAYVPPTRNLLWQNSVLGNVAAWKMNTTQYLNSVTFASGIPSEWRVAGYADLTGDGTPDLVWQNYTTGDAAYWQMSGSQQVSTGSLASGIPLNWKIVAVADINADGQPDLIWRDNNTGDAAYWQMNGTQYMSSGSLASGIPLNWKIVAVADVTGDGKNDLIWANTNTGDYAYWQMNGTTYVSSGSLAVGIPLVWQVVAVSDVTGDGKPDLIWRNTATGDVSYWKLNGVQYVSSGSITTGIPVAWRIIGLQ